MFTDYRRAFSALEMMGIALFLETVYALLLPIAGTPPPDNTWTPWSVPMALSLKSFHFVVGDTPGCDLIAVGKTRGTATIKFANKWAGLAQGLGYDTQPHDLTRMQYFLLLNDIQARLPKNDL